jgi:putative MFS transporter
MTIASQTANRDVAAAPYRIFSDRRSLWSFWAGCAIVTLGVVLHLPMYWMARDMGFRLAGMPMDPGMLVGMALIVVGIGVTGFGLLPKTADPLHPHTARVAISPPENAPLTLAHWSLMIVLVVALVVDVMKPASLGFVVPGMIKEYGVPKSTVAWLPFSALTGTVVGSVVWGWMADIFGRRASILLSSVMFVGTSICGAMPSLWWNVVMCFLMGAAAGGMLPIAYALLAEAMPSKHRGWSLVLVGGIGGAGGYLAASGASALLQPDFGWRIMWFLNLPTGLLLIVLNGFIPESAKFLLALGRKADAQGVMQRFGSKVRLLEPGEEADEFAEHAEKASKPPPAAYAGKTLALSVTALSWSFVNFGLLLWLPNELIAHGYSMGLSSKLLAQSALIALPTVALTALLYSRWSTKWALVVSAAATAAGLLWVFFLVAGPSGQSPVLPVGLLVVGSNGMLAILLPYTAENYPLRVRGRATGWVAACSKAGGLVTQALAIMSAVPGLNLAALVIAVPNLLAMLLVAVFGSETRGRDLRELER